MGGGILAANKKKGFAISGILYPLLILTLFLVVQLLFMLQTRKNVLDKTRTELSDSVNKSNQVYNNEELSTLVDELKSRVTVLEGAVKDSEMKILNNTDPTTLTKDGKYYISSIINGPYGTSGYFEVDTSSDHKWRRVTYKYNRGSAIFENIMVEGNWTGWKLIDGQVELWTGSLIPSDTPVTFANDLRPYSTLRFYINNGEYTIDAAYDRKVGWLGGTTGWAHPSAAMNEVYAIGAYTSGDNKITIRSVNRSLMNKAGTLTIDSSKAITKIIGRP